MKGLLHCISIWSVIALCNAYGYRFRRVPGTNDCRLQLNLPGYPPSFNSALDTRYSNKFTGASYGSKQRYPAKNTFSGSSSGGSYSSSASSGFNSGSDAYDKLGSSSGSSHAFQNSGIHDMVECRGGEIYSFKLRRCVARGNTGYQYTQEDFNDHSVSAPTDGISSNNFQSSNRNTNNKYGQGNRHIESFASSSGNNYANSGERYNPGTGSREFSQNSAQQTEFQSYGNSQGRPSNQNFQSSYSQNEGYGSSYNPQTVQHQEYEQHHSSNGGNRHYNQATSNSQNSEFFGSSASSSNREFASSAGNSGSGGYNGGQYAENYVPKTTPTKYQESQQFESSNKYSGASASAPSFDVDYPSSNSNGYFSSSNSQGGSSSGSAGSGYFSSASDRAPQDFSFSESQQSSSSYNRPQPNFDIIETNSGGQGGLFSASSNKQFSGSSSGGAYGVTQGSSSFATGSRDSEFNQNTNYKNVIKKYADSDEVIQYRENGKEYIELEGNTYVRQRNPEVGGTAAGSASTYSQSSGSGGYTNKANSGNNRNGQGYQSQSEFSNWDNNKYLNDQDHQSKGSSNSYLVSGSKVLGNSQSHGGGWGSSHSY